MKHSMLVLTLAATAAACGDPGVDLGKDDGFDDVYHIVTDISPTGTHDLDILFVIDNSGSMAEEQAALLGAMSADFVGVLEDEFGVRPNLHVAIASTDVGAGPFNISGCTGTGDNGVFQSDPRNTGCTPPDGTFLSDILPEDGPREVNYTGTFDEAFGCVARLGIDGCGFEQPLESMRLALDGTNPENAGFLRADAMLAIVFLTDEDDCSVFDPQMFDTSQNSVDDPLGPLSSFRCFEFGVQCEEDTPRTEGVRDNCIPREDSEYMTSVSEYVEFVQGLKSDPTKIVVTGITGPSSPVIVGADMNGNPKLEPACDSPGGTADAAVRLSSFIGSFPGRAVAQSICGDGSLSAELRYASSVIAGAANQSPCIIGPLEDIDQDAAGLQYDCRVYDAENRGTANEIRTPIRACDNSDTSLPCHRLTGDSAMCGHTESTLRVEVTRDAGDIPDTHVLVRCRVPNQQ